MFRDFSYFNNPWKPRNLLFAVNDSISENFSIPEFITMDQKRETKIS